jgi:hypothetical protein
MGFLRRYQFLRHPETIHHQVTQKLNEPEDLLNQVLSQQNERTEFDIG